MKESAETRHDHLELLTRLATRLPRFEDGRIDYTTSAVAPVVNCIVCHGNRVLLLKRSNRVGEEKGKWSGVDGYIDELKPLRDIVLTELREELGIEEKDVTRLQVAESYEAPDRKAKKTWVVFPVLVELDELPEITLDWEHTQYRWIKPSEIVNFDILPGQDRVLSSALALR